MRLDRLTPAETRELLETLETALKYGHRELEQVSFDYRGRRRTLTLGQVQELRSRLRGRGEG